MTILKHLGITVSDLDASVTFYRDVVGMTLRSHRGPKVMGDWYDTLTENQGAVVASAHLELGGFLLQLLEYQDPRSPADLSHASPGSPHLCFGIDGGLETRHRALSTAGHQVSPMVHAIDHGFRSFYILDPDGVPVELWQAQD